MRGQSVLVSSLFLTVVAFAWLQAGSAPQPAVAQTVTDDDCLEQEEKAPADGEARMTRLRSLTGRAPLSPEMIEQVLLVAQDVDPTLAESLRRQRQRDPEAFVQAMRTTGRRLQGMAELRTRDPKLYAFKLQEMRIDKQVLSAAQRVREAIRHGSNDVEALREDLRTYVAIQQALSIKARAEYLARLREHIAALEEHINRDVLNFENAIDDRIRQLLAAPGAVTSRGEVIPAE